MKVLTRMIPMGSGHMSGAEAGDTVPVFIMLVQFSVTTYRCTSLTNRFGLCLSWHDRLVNINFE